MKRFAMFATLLGALLLSDKSADAQVIYGPPAPVRRAVRSAVSPYGYYYYYGPRYYYGPAYTYGPRYYGGYWSPWGGYYW
jgi:hypothetical protein